MASRLLSLATAQPKHVITREITREGLVRAVPPQTLGRYLGMIDGSGVETRASVLPLEDLFRLTDVSERTNQYVEHAIALGEEVSRRALAEANVAPADVDVFVTASCTGYMMPSLEARLAPRLGTSPDVRRVPLTELGCSAGAASLGLASDLLATGRSRNALVLSVELCSLCLQTTDLEMMDVVGALLFGDGAAAAVVGADATRGLEIVASRSVLWANSLDELGMRLTPTGLRLGLSTALVRLVRGHLRATVDAFLAKHGVALRDLRFFAMHPGGPSILKAVAEALELVEGAIRPSWDVWHRCGNMSSATVFFILDEILRTAPPKPGDLGLALAFGPGVSCEMVLLRA